ncbi:MAG: VanW family protein [Patescibacteria group bacterium]|nr:VanW family protein [Patescibacteria group bacterium]
MWQWILKRKIRRYKRWLLNILTIVLFVVAGVSVGFFVYQVVCAEKIYGGVYIGPYSMAGKTHLEAEKFLQEKTDEFLSASFEFNAPGKQLHVEPVMISPSGPEFSYSLVSYALGNTVAEAFRTGRSDSIPKNILATVGLIFKRRTIPIKFNLNENVFLEILKENFESLENQPQNVRMEVSFKNNSKTPYIKIIPERNGRIFDFDEALRRVGENTKNLKQKSIRMTLDGVTPEIKSSEINSALNGLSDVFQKTPLTLKYAKQRWKINRDDLASMLVFKKDKNSKVILGLDDKLAEKIDAIAEEIDIKPTSAKFVLENDRVIEFQIAKEGQILDKELSVEKIEEVVFGLSDEKELDLVVREITPLVTTESINTMGIKEVVGVGESNFAWSPTNRRHNIDVGSQKLHGLIIEPDEIFSLNTAIGAVNAATGFLPELVIKGNRTISEYGGGLCQIATTMFRAALNSGLEILERQNHSYRVSYYEPPVGTDATIYNPYPDLKFKNTTGHSLVIQSEINGDDLVYTLWGTDDGREVEMSAPVMWDITNPPPAKLIETLDLYPGVKRCTEHAHKGASVYFDYTITLPDGEVIEKRFTSFYRPWQEVCLVGVEELSATSTPSIAIED